MYDEIITHEFLNFLYEYPVAFICQQEQIAGIMTSETKYNVDGSLRRFDEAGHEMYPEEAKAYDEYLLELEQEQEQEQE